MIPPRFVPRDLDPTEVQAFCELCDAIENGVIERQEVTPLLSRWNARANRTYGPLEFTQYYGAMDRDEFVRTALAKAPELVSDLTYAELREVLASVMEVQVVGAELSYYLDWLRVQLPGSDIANLIFNASEWFGTAEARTFDFTPDQLLCAAMKRCGYYFNDAPEISLPFAVPAARVLVTPPTLSS